MKENTKSIANARAGNGENGFRIKPKIVSAFKWDGNTRDPHSVPAWVKMLIRNARLNEATTPPSLILDTLTQGSINIRPGMWCVYHVEAGVILQRTDEAFQRLYEPNT